MSTFLVGRLGRLIVGAFLIGGWGSTHRVWADDALKPVSTGKCMMWKVSSNTATVYLVGSMHLATPDMYPLPKEMEEAFGKSDVLVVEVNINKTDQTKVIQLVQEKGMYKNGETLSGSISKDDWDALKEVVNNLGLPEAGVEKMKPWVVGLTIEVLSIQKMGLDPKLGIDKHFLDLADKNNKPIEELESMEFQVGTLAGFDAKMQELALAAMVNDIKDLKDDIGKLKDAWVAGDAKAMSDLLAKGVKKQPELAEYQKKIIDDRNGPMAEKVENYLKGSKTIFVIAGVAHMVGEKGIVKILRDHGDKVEQSAATEREKDTK